MRNGKLQRHQLTLLKMRDRSREEIRRMIQVVRDTEMAVGEHDRCVSESFDKELELERTEEMIQGLVSDALARIEQGTFGKCQRCCHVIPQVRLNALPFAPYCVKCEQDSER